MNGFAEKRQQLVYQFHRPDMPPLSLPPALQARPGSISKQQTPSSGPIGIESFLSDTPSLVDTKFVH
jgi:hypothetical protein